MSEPTQTTDANGDNVAQFPAGGEGQESERESLLRQPNQEFLDKLKAANEELNEIAAERKELNDKKGAIFANFERYGLNKHAVRAAIKYNSMDPEQRDNFDLSYAVMRKALGQPVQDDMFIAAAEATVRDHAKH